MGGQFGKVWQASTAQNHWRSQYQYVPVPFQLHLTKINLLADLGHFYHLSCSSKLRYTSVSSEPTAQRKMQHAPSGVEICFGAGEGLEVISPCNLPSLTHRPSPKNLADDGTHVQGRYFHRVKGVPNAWFVTLEIMIVQYIPGCGLKAAQHVREY